MDLISKKEEIDFDYTLTLKMINFDVVIKEETKEDYSNWPQVPDHLYKILIFGGSGSRKTN